MQESHLQDIFGVGDKEAFAKLYQDIGIVLALAALAGIGLSSNRVSKFFSLGALPFVLLFSARGPLVALVCSLFFLTVARFSARARKLTLVAATAVIMMMLTSALFYQRTIQSKDLGLDAISRTIREIRHPPPGLRVAIWTQTWQRISSEPNRLLFGRGIGMYPVIESFGAPEWLLRKTEGSKHYPHNTNLEMLYETGIVGLLLFIILTLFPLGFALRRWHLFSLVQKSAISMYVFQIVSSQLSGAFAFGYLDKFFFALAVGIIALNRLYDVLVRDKYVAQGAK